MSTFDFRRSTFACAGLLLLIPAVGYATTFHVATIGDDDAPGVQHAPFATINRGVKALAHGDTLIVHAGTYRESVVLPKDGRPDAPVAVRALDDEAVIVAGDDPVTGWKEASPGHWQAPCKGPVTQVFWDGAMLTEACWPNTPANPLERDWAEADKGTKPGVIVDADLPDLDVTGARIHVLPGRYWVSWTRTVNGHDRQAHTLAVTTDWSQGDAYKVAEGTRYYLYGARALLDAPGEWWFDSENNVLHVMAAQGAIPREHTITAKRRELAFDLRGRSHVRLEGFRVHAATINMADAKRCLVEDCHIRYASHITRADGWAARNDTGFVVGGRENMVRRCSVIYSAGNGISLLGEHNMIENCIVRYTDYIATDLACVWAEGRGNAVRHCTLSHTGRSVFIHRKMKAGIIAYNDMHHAGMLTTDLGITYCFQTDGEGTVITHNWVHDNVAGHVGVGIYIDNGSRNFLIHHNVSWNNQNSGIRLNTPSTDNRVYNNTVIENGDSVSYWGPNGLDDQPGCELINNVLTDKVEIGEGMTAHHNYTGDAPLLRKPKARDFRPSPGSPLIDAGVQLPGITDGYRGDAPDIGAYEFGAPPWTAGHDWDEPPTF